MGPIFVTDVSKLWADQDAPKKELKDLTKAELIGLVKVLFLDMGHIRARAERAEAVSDALIINRGRA